MRHFELLMRIYAMLSRMAHTATARAELLAAALSYLARVWSVSAHGASVREAKECARAKLRGAANAAEAKQIRETPLVPGAHGAAVHAVPSEPSGWLRWAPSDRLLALMDADRKNRAINARALRRPALTLAFLERMRTDLDASGLLLEQALVLQTAQHIAQRVLPASADGAAVAPALAALAVRRRASLCERLGLAPVPYTHLTLPTKRIV